MSVEFDERVEIKEKLAPPKRYNLWVIDNDITSFDEVVKVLVAGAGLSVREASVLTYRVDSEGKAKVNKTPLSRNIADALNKRLNDTKRIIAIEASARGRGQAVMELKFAVKEN